MIGGRLGAVSWIDASGNLWIFGGRGTGGSGVTGSELNDLWRWDGSNWAWMAGDTTNSQSSVYGVKGSSSLANTPGARFREVSWVDRSGNLWLFGGNGYATSSIPGYLNDFWQYR
jgi:N-acetylneuraminic acid mutarotase